MNDDPQKMTPYSADVRLWMHLGTNRVRLAQVGPDFVIVRTPQALAAGSADIVISIDGREKRYPVSFGGVSPGNNRATIGPPDQVPI